MENIKVSQESPRPGSGQADKEWVFKVVVGEGASSTKHTVTVNRQDKERLSPKHSAEELVRASFLFLLEREPKESILSSFNLMLIGQYFSEYKEKIQKYF